MNKLPGLQLEVSTQVCPMHPCFLIPLYNHGETLSQVVGVLSSHQFPIIVVDDGSHQATKLVAAQIADANPLVTLLTLSKNQGKGAAVMTGLRYAAEQGWTHALQLDADAQHDFSDVPYFMYAIRQYPNVLWSGLPVYDASVPAVRFYGRYLTHVLVWLQTLSLEIRDSMCGFRAYPIQEILPVINQHDIPSRMVFDTEVMVRFFWRGGRVGYVPTKVIYPEAGISHFRMWRDNRQLAWMHCRLVLGMLWRLPQLVRQRRQRKKLMLFIEKS